MKKTLQLEETHLVELSSSELRYVNGGNPWIIGIGVGLVVTFFTSFGDIRHGLVDGFNGTPRY